VVSVSGDGGYNEVVDGVMHADNPEAVCAVMAAGNANDHRRTTREQPLADAIVAGDVRHIDLLRLTTGTGADARTQYAYSYIGMGLTPIVAIDLEKGGKGSLREIVSVVADLRPIPALHHRTRRRPTAPIRQPPIRQHPANGQVRDTQRHRPAQRRPLRGHHPAAHLQMANPHHRHQTPLQLDGELLTLNAGTPVQVAIAPAALATIG
jgi:diacylglycerol kinase family enzyme